jgi:hypothetical protein
MATKRHLFHTLNQRARRQKQEQEEREREKLEAWINDPRHKTSMERIEPLIEEE